MFYRYEQYMSISHLAIFVYMAVQQYETKQSDGDVTVMLGLWGMRSTPLLLLLPGPLWPGVVAPDRALSMG